MHTYKGSPTDCLILNKRMSDHQIREQLLGDQWHKATASGSVKVLMYAGRG